MDCMEMRGEFLALRVHHKHVFTIARHPYYVIV